MEAITKVNGDLEWAWLEDAISLLIIVIFLYGLDPNSEMSYIP